MIKFLLKLAFGNPYGLLVIGGVVLAAVAGAVVWYHVQINAAEKRGALAERAVWVQLREELEAKRDAERARAARELQELAQEVVATEDALAEEKLENADALARALAQNASDPLCTTIDDSVLQLFRKVGRAR